MSVIYEYLENVCEILDSYRIPITAKDRKNGKYPYYGANGLQDYVDDYIFDDELVLLAEDGGNFGSKERPIAYRVSGKCWVNNHAHVLKAKACIDINYLCYSLMFYNTDGIVNGATRKKLTQSAMRQMRIPLRNMAEQQKIVVRIDKVIQVIEKHHNEIRMLDELVQSRFVEMFGDPEHNTKRFPLLKLGKLCKVGSSKRIYQNEQSTFGIPFLRVSDLNDRIDKGKAVSELFIPLEKYEKLQGQGLVPQAGDILITSRGTIGKCYIVKDEDRFYFQDGMISWLSEIDKRVMGLYIAYLFGMPGMQKQITSLQAGSTVAYLSISMLKELDIMLPPLALQEQFVAFIRQSDKSKLTVQKSLEKLEILKKSLMQQYFGQEGTEKWRK